MLEQGRARALLLGNTLIASTLVLPWPAASASSVTGSVAWISMVLVLPEHRGQGHAGRLLRESLEWLADPVRSHLLPVLDATPAGRPVYLRQGFIDGWTFNRWERTQRLPTHGSLPIDPTLEIHALPQTPEAFQRDGSLHALDTLAFGADRSSLLNALLQRAPQSAFVAHRSGSPCGYVLARPGRRATQIGPLLAADQAAAEALLAAALQSIEEPVFIDVPQARSSVESALIASGFTIQRPFTRMFRPPQNRAKPPHPLPADPPSSVWAVAGPELG